MNEKLVSILSRILYCDMCVKSYQLKCQIIYLYILV
nr:MAG TPA: hypothetical protein [Caudoviricetes sp.]